MNKHPFLFALILSLIFSFSTFAQNQPPILLELKFPIAPMPVQANGKTLLIYELHITNFITEPIEVTQIDVFNNESGSNPLRSFKNKELEVMIKNVGRNNESPATRLIKPGERAIVFLQITLDHKTPVPNVLQHSLYVAHPNIKNSVQTIQAGKVSVIKNPLPIISPPLQGGGWVSVNGPSNTSLHRRTILPIEGSTYIAQRFAIDWMKLGTDGKLFKNNAKKNENFYGYGENLFAVADATVVNIKDGIPENDMTAQEFAVPITLDAIGGNYVILDIGNGYFAFYAHMIPGSLKVRVGDKVKVGQILGKLGNTGNSGAPHLHFHITNGNSPLGAEGVPYLINSFELLGTASDFDSLFKGTIWKPDAAKQIRQKEIPVENSVLRFPLINMLALD